MQRLIYLFVFASCLLNLTPTNAQTATNSDFDDIYAELEILERNDNNWSFYADTENMAYFIDFATIDFNLSDIIIKDGEGQVIFEDEVLNLPLDTIYEIDFSPFGPGSYDIELHSFTGFMKKNIEIK